MNLSDPSRPATIKASLLNGSITVKGYDGKEVVAEARVRSGDSRRGPRGWRSDSDDRPSRSDDGSTPPPTAGMKRLSLAATGLAVEEDANVVRVSTDSVNRTIDLVISVPRQSSVVIRTVNDGNITVSDITGDIDVNDTNGSVTLDHISGSVVAHALNGKVRATFDHVGQKSMAFSSLNGAIDVTFPPDLKANLLIRSDRGDVYSDFDVQLATGAQQSSRRRRPQKQRQVSGQNRQNDPCHHQRRRPGNSIHQHGGQHLHPQNRSLQVRRIISTDRFSSCC